MYGTETERGGFLFCVVYYVFEARIGLVTLMFSRILVYIDGVLVGFQM